MEGPSFVERIGQSMNASVDYLRQQAAQSIENIMFEMVANWNGADQPCTRVDCMLAASVEASRIYIMNQQFNAATHPEDHMTDEHHYYPADGTAATAGEYEKVGGEGTYPKDNTAATTTRTATD